MENTVIILLVSLISLAIYILFLLEKMRAKLDKKNELETIEPQFRNLEQGIKSDFSISRIEIQDALKNNREELSNSQRNFGEQFSTNVINQNNLLKEKFNDQTIKHEKIKQETEQKLNEIRQMVELKLNHIQEDNNKKLEDMRKTVDEKLQESINTRFNESFTIISKRLEEVHRGLGEMQNLANDVGGLKKVLTNVKTRGVFGEVLLENILEQIFVPSQYEMQVAVKANTQERVDAVVKLPGQTSDGTDLLLPIDSKFPTEDYHRLHEAYEIGDIKEIQNLRKAFENSVKNTAKGITSKYINVPKTTDFAIMFVPSEGIYAEILRSPDIFESLRKDHKITVVGPTNLAAFLSSLQMGFRTLAIHKRTSEVWEVLGAVKTEFGKFGTVLDKASKQLQTVANSISETGIRTRAIEKKLKNVESLPEEQTIKFFDEVTFDEIDFQEVENENS